MKKFFVLVKKEIQELLTPQLLVPLLVVVLAFNFIGKIIGKEVAKKQAPQPVEVIDLDNSMVSRNAIKILTENKFVVNVSFEDNREEIIKQAKEKKEKAIMVIPLGFETGLKNFQPQKIDIYTILTNFSVTGSRETEILKSGINLLNENISNQMLAQIDSQKNPEVLKRPLAANDFVVVGDKQANISPAAVAGFITSQTTFIPIVLFMVIIFASQMIATSIASEKENKTLETLLSSPVSRKSIVASKLFAAGLVALVTAVVYIFGMRNYMTSMMGGAATITLDEGTKNVISQLGLVLGTGDYLLLGLSLFFGILAALAIAFILGSFAEDTKSAQGVIAPLMILILIPYFLTLFLDFSSLSPAIKIFIYAIPFSHPFMAAPNLLLGQEQNVWYGIAYLAFFFLIAVIIAAKIFSTERIFTMKISFKRGKAKKPRGQNSF
jgi:ABC-2 type transport system permease protein